MHFFVTGKIMLGSDAPSLFFTNALLVVGAIMHFGIVLPKLAHLAEYHVLEGYDTKSDSGSGSDSLHHMMYQPLFLLSSKFWMFWISLTLFVLSWIFLWISACMDPGILPGKPLFVCLSSRSMFPCFRKHVANNLFSLLSCLRLSFT